MMANKEQDNPFYKPLWRRVAIVASIVAWLAFELYMESSGLWIAIPAGMLAYAVYILFITWPKDNEPKA
jgi:hypothetical protein